MMRCPSCGAFVASTDSNCWKCNVPLAGDGEAGAPAPQEGEGTAPPQEPTPEAPEPPAPPEPAPEAAPPAPEPPVEPEPAPPAPAPEPEPAPPPAAPAPPAKEPEPAPAPEVGTLGTPPPETAPPEKASRETPPPKEEPESPDEDDFAEMDGSAPSKGPAPPPRFEPRFGERAPDEEPAEEPSEGEDEAPKERRPAAPKPVKPKQRRTAAPPRPKGPDVYRPRRGFSEGKQEAIAPPTKWKNYNIGTFISLAAVIILFMTFLLPWYYIELGAQPAEGEDSGTWETDNGTRIVEINGHDPILMDVSPFTANNNTVGVSEDPLEGYFPIPMGILWGSMLAISMFYRFTRNKPWRRGKKFIKTGVLLLIFLIVFLVIFSKVHTALPDAGGEVFSKIEASPLWGTYEGEIEGWEGAEVKMSWGIEIGWILALLASILFIVGGTLEYVYGMRAKRELEDAMAHIGRMPFRERKEEEQPEKKGRFRRK